jgi:hypothetical protein
MLSVWMTHEDTQLPVLPQVKKYSPPPTKQILHPKNAGNSASKRGFLGHFLEKFEGVKNKTQALQK